MGEPAGHLYLMNNELPEHAADLPNNKEQNELDSTIVRRGRDPPKTSVINGRNNETASRHARITTTGGYHRLTFSFDVMVLTVYLRCI